MRASVLLNIASAVAASASPQLLEERSHDACYKAVANCPTRKAECSAFQKATITPCSKTVTKTVTATKTAGVKVTLTSLVTQHIVQTVTAATETDTTTVYLHTNLPVAADKRAAAPKCPSSSKPYKVPGSVDKGCKDSTAYALACAAFGIKPSTTTLPAGTVTVTKTVAKTVTATSSVIAKQTIKATSTETVTPTVVVAETDLPAPTGCYYLYSREVEYWVGAVPFAPAPAQWVSSSGMAMGVTLTDNGGTSGFLYTINDRDGSQLAFTSESSNSDSIDEVDFDYIDDVPPPAHNLVCTITPYTFDTAEGVSNKLSCTSSLVAGSKRTAWYSCQFNRQLRRSSSAILALADPLVLVPEECTAVKLEVKECSVVDNQQQRA